MEGEIIPFQVSKGAVITASFRGETDESIYVWIRRFESEAQREKMYKDIYESEFWKAKIAPQVGDQRAAHRADAHVRGAVDDAVPAVVPAPANA